MFQIGIYIVFGFIWTKELSSYKSFLVFGGPQRHPRDQKDICKLLLGKKDILMGVNCESRMARKGPNSRSGGLSLII